MYGMFFALLIALTQVAGAPARTVVAGRVTGADGKPLPAANVFLLEPNDSAVVRSAAAARDGRFKIEIDSNGIWILRFTGVGHYYHDVSLLVEKPQTIYVDVRLKAYHFVQDPFRAEVIGDFNNWSISKAVPMKKDTAGAYSTVIKTEKSEISYRLRYVREGGDVEGANSSGYISNGRWGYNSVVPATNGEARIVLDPGKLIRSEEPAKIAFKHTDGTVSAFALIYDKLENGKSEEETQFLGYERARPRDARPFRYDWSNLSKWIEMRLKSESIPVLRAELYLGGLMIAMITRQAGSSFYDELLKNVPADSPVWVLNPHGIFYALNHSSLTEAGRDAFVMEVVARNKNRKIKPALLMDEFMASKLAGDAEKAKRYFELLQNKFASSVEARQIRKVYGNSFVLAAGKQAPAFSVTSIDNPRVVSNESLKGRYCLIEFWSSGDRASVEQVKYLADAYLKFKGSDFEILSLSVDSSYIDVVRFRANETAMPWLNAYLGANFGNPVVKSFGAYEIPTAFLLDPEGKIAAAGNELLGSELGKTLSRFLDK